MKKYFAPNHVNVIAMQNGVKLFKETIYLPDWSAYITFDKNGEVFVYEKEPFFNEKINAWDLKVGDICHVADMEQEVINYLESCEYVINGMTMVIELK